MRRRMALIGGLAVAGSAAAGTVAQWGTGSEQGQIQTSSLASAPAVATEVKVPGLNRSLYLPPRADVRLLVLSDLNSAYGSLKYEPEVARALDLIPYWQPDIVLGGGDMVAGQDPRLTAERIRDMWESFDTQVAARLRQAKLIYGFTLGNHDASSARSIKGQPLFAQERQLAAAYWNDPKRDTRIPFVDRAKFPFYYTFEHKDIFYLIWDATSSYIPPEEIAWAEQALASPRAQAAKLRIAIGHLPLYAVAVGRDYPGEVLTEADQKRALLEKYRVHLYISGHHHAYYPGHRGQLNLLHSGILGSGPRPLIDSRLPPRKAITLIDVNLVQGSTVWTTYNMRNLQLIDQGGLPRFLTGHNGVVLRRDVEWADLSAEERAACQAKLGSLCRA